MDKAQLKKALKPIVRELMIEVLGERVLDEVVHRVVVESSDDLDEDLVAETRGSSESLETEEVSDKRRKLIEAAKSRRPKMDETRLGGGGRSSKKSDEPFGRDFLDEVAADNPQAAALVRTMNSIGG